MLNHYRKIGTDRMTEPKHISELKPDYKTAMDIRGTPTTICPCGSMVWNLKAMFDSDTGNISMYFMDMECAECGTVATAPTPEDYNVSDL
jgi:hypothetical protein